VVNHHFDGCTIDGNWAGSSGGGIFAFGIDGINYFLTDTDVTDNHADVNGGGITLVLGGNLDISDDCLIADNTAGISGGGVYSAVDIPFLVKSLEDRFTEAKGSLFFAGSTIISISASMVQDNTAVLGNGGGIHQMGGDLLVGKGIFAEVETLIVDDSEVLNNHAGHDGGGIYFVGFLSPEFCQENCCSSCFICKDGDKGCAEKEPSSVPPGCEACCLGGFCPFKEGKGAPCPKGIGSFDAVCTVRSSNVNGNRADTGKGGGIFFAEGILLDLDGTTLDQNTASEFGGGIYFGGTTQFADPCESCCQDCECITKGLCPAKEKGICLDCCETFCPLKEEKGCPPLEAFTSTLDCVSGTISDNWANGGGGGISVAGTDLVACLLENTDVLDNHTDGNGGGIEIVNGGFLGVSNNCLFSGNRAGFSGGGIYSGIEGGMTQIDPPSLEKGGLSYPVFGFPTVQIADSTIEGNTAESGNGGGVRQGGDQMLMPAKGLALSGRCAAGL